MYQCDTHAILANFLKQRLGESRLRMARIPEGAVLIDNPVSGAPGFTMDNVHVMAGVPAVFKAMVGSIVPAIASGKPMISQTLRVDQGEGDVAAPLAKLAGAFPDLSIGSYPFQMKGAFGTNIVIRGHDGTRVTQAMGELIKLYPENAT